MTVYIGCDFHPYQQTVAYCDTADGVIHYRTLRHDREVVDAFYKQFPGRTVVGIEASTSFDWFESMLFERQQRLLVGHPAEIRRRARSRHKSDKRDAELILELLLKDEFPAIWRRPQESQTVLQQLRFRHSLVKQRTAVCNHLQALARLAGLPRRKAQTAAARAALLRAAFSDTQAAERDQWLALLDDFDRRIDELDTWCQGARRRDERATLLLTHPGVGDLTALGVVHTLGDVARFNNARQIVSFVGLDPVEHSSADKRRCGAISKAGSKLLRFLLVQAAQASLRSDHRLRSFYARVSRRRGKQVAKVAAARKLLVNLSIMLRDRIDYREFTRRGVEVSLPV